MEEKIKTNTSIKFKPDYRWPTEGSNKNCPKCNTPLTLNENRPEYMGKPWWCNVCKWQFSDEEV